MISSLRLQDVAETAIDQFVDGNRMDVAIAVDLKLELREVLRGVTPDLLAALLTIEARIVPRAVERLVGGDIIEWEPLVWAERREGDDVPIGTNPFFDRSAELQQYAGRILVRVSDGDRLIDLKILDVAQPLRRVVHAG